MLSIAEGEVDFPHLRENVKRTMRLERTLKHRIVDHPGHCIREIMFGIATVRESLICFQGTV